MSIHELKGFPTLGVLAPSLHRESTDSLTDISGVPHAVGSRYVCMMQLAHAYTYVYQRVGRLSV